jgi:orotidine-5'-phosphate decarboxylase
MSTTEMTAGSGAPGLQPGFHFADAVITRSRALGHCFCLGLDPHLAMIPAAFRRGSMDARAAETITAIEDFLTAVIDVAAPDVVAVKPQSAMYERLGSAGVALLERVVAYAHDRGVIIVLDAKRGDIGSTAEAYAEAYLAPDGPNPVECLTVNPYMGLDTLEPYFRLCHTYGRGIIVLVKTSNPGSDDFQNLKVGNSTVYGSVALALRPMVEALIGPETGWSSLGVVAGATYPREAADIRALLPRALFLIPGFGYQGGSLKQFAAALVPGPAGREGGLISSSRATLFPPEAAHGNFETWKSAFTDTLARHIAAVAGSLKG